MADPPPYVANMSIPQNIEVVILSPRQLVALRVPIAERVVRDDGEVWRPAD